MAGGKRGVFGGVEWVGGLKKTYKKREGKKEQRLDVACWSYGEVPVHRIRT